MPDLRQGIQGLRATRAQVLLPHLLRAFEGETGMSRETALIHYRAAVAVFRTWLESGLITDADYNEIEAAAAEKYGLPERSIYR
jgi:hypothetical protein